MFSLKVPFKDSFSLKVILVAAGAGSAFQGFGGVVIRISFEGAATGLTGTAGAIFGEGLLSGGLRWVASSSLASCLTQGCPVGLPGPWPCCPM